MKSDFAAKIAQMATEFGQVDATALENRIRDEFSGRRVTIRERPVVTPEKIDGLLRQRMSVFQISRETGLSRTTIYRLLGDRKVPKRA